MTRKGSIKALAVLPVLGAVLAAISNVAASLLATAFGVQHPKTYGKYSWYVLVGVLLIALIDAIVKGLLKKTESPSAYRPISPSAEASAKRNVVLFMKQRWIQGCLEKSLYSIARLELKLDARSNLYANRSELLLGTGDTKQVPVKGDTAHTWLNDFGCALVLGDAGAGKTTRIAELVRDFLSRLEQDSTAPIPIALDLANWTAKQGPIQKWCIEQLRTHVSTEILQGWIENAQIILLLDALDQVPPGDREACVTAINEFRTSFREVPVVISCRTSEHQTAYSALQVNTILTIHPLTRESIDAAVAEDIEDLAGLRKVLDQIPDLYGTLQTPLMLDVARIVYAKSGEALPIVQGTPEQFRRQLLDAYVARMIHAAELTGRSKVTQTVRALGWIALNLKKYGHTYFDSDSLVALSWCSDEIVLRSLKWTSGIVGAISGLVFGALLGAVGLRLGLLVVHRPEWFLAWSGAVIGGLGGVLCAAPLNCWSFFYNAWTAGPLSLADRVMEAKGKPPRWFVTFLDAPTWMLYAIGVICAAIKILVFALPALLVIAGGLKFPPGPVVGMSTGAILGLLWTAAVARGLAKCASKGQSPDVYDLTGLWLLRRLKKKTGVGIEPQPSSASEETPPPRSKSPRLNRWLLVGLLLVIGIPVAVPLVIFGLVAIAVAVLTLRLIVPVQSVVVRFVLWFGLNLPLSHEKFLRFATARALLRQEFGKYQFVHPLLKDFFADIAQTPSNPTAMKEHL